MIAGASFSISSLRIMPKSTLWLVVLLLLPVGLLGPREARASGFSYLDDYFLPSAKMALNKIQQSLGSGPVVSQRAGAPTTTSIDGSLIPVVGMRPAGGLELPASGNNGSNKASAADPMTGAEPASGFIRLLESEPANQAAAQQVASGPAGVSISLPPATEAPADPVTVVSATDASLADPSSSGRQPATAVGESAFSAPAPPPSSTISHPRTQVDGRELQRDSEQQRTTNDNNPQITTTTSSILTSQTTNYNPNPNSSPDASPTSSAAPVPTPEAPFSEVEVTAAVEPASPAPKTEDLSSSPVIAVDNSVAPSIVGAAAQEPAPTGSASASPARDDYAASKEAERDAVAAVDASINFGDSALNSLEDTCYDEFGNARYCEPEFENVAFERLVEVSSECGSPSPSKFCLASQAQAQQPNPNPAASNNNNSNPSINNSNTDASSSNSTSNQFQRNCHICDSQHSKLRHPASHLTDFHEPGAPTCWVSAPLPMSGGGSANLRRDNVSLVLNLAKKYEIAYVSMQFCSLKPDSLSIYKSTDFGLTWQPFQFYSSHCQRIYALAQAALGPSAATQSTPRNPSNHQMVSSNNSSSFATCTSLPAASPSRVSFSTLQGTPPDSQAGRERSASLADWQTATNLRIVLDRPQLGDQPQAAARAPAQPQQQSDPLTQATTSPISSSSHPIQQQQQQQSPQPTGATTAVAMNSSMNLASSEFLARPSDSYNYAIADLTVGARCKCNGHASQCVLSRDRRSLECDCRHNTAGRECERCAPFHFDRPWARASQFDGNSCQPCNCNGHSRKCYFDAELYRLSGRRSGGVCLACQDNTTGRHCNYCLEGFARDLSRPMSDKEACKPCECHPLGSLGRVCNQTSGQCPCRDGVIGLQCNRCAPGYQQSNSPNEPCIKLPDRELALEPSIPVVDIEEAGQTWSSNRLDDQEATAHEPESHDNNNSHHQRPAPTDDTEEQINNSESGLVPADEQSGLAATETRAHQGRRQPQGSHSGRRWQQNKHQQHQRVNSKFNSKYWPAHYASNGDESQEAADYPDYPSAPSNRYYPQSSHLANGHAISSQSHVQQKQAGYAGSRSRPHSMIRPGLVGRNRYPVRTRGYEHARPPLVSNVDPDESGVAGAAGNQETSGGHHPLNSMSSLNVAVSQEELGGPAILGSTSSEDNQPDDSFNSILEPSDPVPLPAHSSRRLLHQLTHHHHPQQQHQAGGAAQAPPSSQFLATNGHPPGGASTRNPQHQQQLTGNELPTQAASCGECRESAQRRLSKWHFCQLDYALKVNIISRPLMSDDWTRIDAQVLDIFKHQAQPQVPFGAADSKLIVAGTLNKTSLNGNPTSPLKQQNNRIKLNSVHPIWVPTEDVTCKCLRFRTGFTYLIMGSVDSRDDTVTALQLDRHGLALEWQPQFNERLRKYQRRLARGKCRPSEWSGSQSSATG